MWSARRPPVAAASSQAWESVGRRLSGVVAAGVLMVEVTKQLHAPVKPGLRAVVRKPMAVIEALPKPVPGPV